jgi:hypothetical protein
MFTIAHTCLHTHRACDADVLTCWRAELTFFFCFCAQDPANKSFFSEIISSIADVSFTADGRYIIARDYLTLKVRGMFFSDWRCKIASLPF